MNPRLRLVALLVAGAALAGCAALAERDAARERALAKADHAQCELAGLRFPSAEYDRCRRLLEEERRRKDWLQLSLAEQQAADRGNEIVTLPPPSTYRAIDFSRWRCAQRDDGGHGWIGCREE